jgi:hypothetical protein
MVRRAGFSLQNSSYNLLDVALYLSQQPNRVVPDCDGTMGKRSPCCARPFHHRSHEIRILEEGNFLPVIFALKLVVLSMYHHPDPNSIFVNAFCTKIFQENCNHFGVGIYVFDTSISFSLAAFAPIEKSAHSLEVHAFIDLSWI